ncbi:hypothetical protein JYP52_21435 [Nitratireductor aquibiodomus]|uniref:hypothetical protein n=1 Tax=Nitratireductor aquibiodomus TaxID=204799 RepID=UPI0019D39CF2|nr:hypothetical protein [Nitratireductor aquibiodomus]MBN7763705.1 hypothetical protein [Nitratireductor aquibiodomus]
MMNLVDAEAIRSALQPLADIADAYESNALDEARKEWGETDPATVELYQGRGGKRMLTLQDAFRARDAIRSLP